jgi:hypothetical protein
MSRGMPSSFLCRLQRRMFVFSGIALMLAGGVFLFSAFASGFGRERELLCPTGLGAPGAGGRGFTGEGEVDVSDGERAS